MGPQMYKTGLQPFLLMPGLTVTKKVRMDKATAGKLRQLAQALEMTESGVIRDALHRYEILRQLNDRDAQPRKVVCVFVFSRVPHEIETEPVELLNFAAA